MPRNWTHPETGESMDNICKTENDPAIVCSSETLCVDGGLLYKSQPMSTATKVTLIVLAVLLPCGPLAFCCVIMGKKICKQVSKKTRECCKSLCSCCQRSSKRSMEQDGIDFDPEADRRY